MIDQRPLTADELRGEVPATIGGALGRFTFRRAWCYWRVYGDVPIAVAEQLYADPIGVTDIRVAGHCGCPPPREWAEDSGAGLAVRTYHIDSEVGLRIFADAVRKPFQVRIHRPDGVAVWNEHTTLAAAENEAHRLFNGETRIVPASYIGPRDIVEVCDARRFRPKEPRHG